MKVIRFKRLDGKAPKALAETITHHFDGSSNLAARWVECWEIAFNERHLFEKLDGDMAEIIMPAKPWYVRLWRMFRPLRGVEMN